MHVAYCCLILEGQVRGLLPNRISEVRAIKRDIYELFVSQENAIGGFSAQVQQVQRGVHSVVRVSRNVL